MEASINKKQLRHAWIMGIGIMGIRNRAALPRSHPGERLGGRDSSLLEVTAVFLMVDIVRELSNDNVHSGSNQ